MHFKMLALDLGLCYLTLECVPAAVQVSFPPSNFHE